MIAIYRTKDGNEFNTEKEALDHENGIQAVKDEKKTKLEAYKTGELGQTLLKVIELMKTHDDALTDLNVVNGTDVIDAAEAVLQEINEEIQNEDSEYYDSNCW